MNIYARRGSKVVFKNDTAGYSHDQERAQKLLKKGQVYTVYYTDVGGWHTDVYLKEFPNIPFNSVLFEDYGEDYTIRLQGCDAQTMFIANLNEDEINCLRKISELSKTTSTYSCMPVLKISPTTENDRLELEGEEDEF